MIDTTDRRPIETMQFGYEAGKDLSEEERKKAQEFVTAGVRAFLDQCGCVVADDINRLGCTGVARVLLESAPEKIVEQIQHLRIDMAGGGVGLPCFVPPTLFCLAHNTIGGLEDGQQAHHTEMVALISRELTPEEAAKVSAMNVARKIKTREGIEEYMAGNSAAEADEAPEGVTGEEPSTQEEPDIDLNQFRVGRPAWKCPEHTTTNWGCRFCVAQAIVEGPLEPGYIVMQHDLPPQTSYAISAENMEKVLQAWNADGVNKARIYVLAATFTRKLSRD